MANTYTTLNGLFTAIADAIRSKKNSTESIVADNFPTEIESLRAGFDYNNQNITSISDYEFRNCTDLKNVNCYNLESIGTGAFEGCSNLKTVILYDGVESVGENAFKGCSSDLTIYCMFDSQPEGWNENWNTDNCETIWYGEVIETYDISATENDNVTARLCEYSNSYYRLLINGNGDMMYTSCPWINYRGRITKCIILPEVTSIGENAFSGCTSLTSVTIPDSVTNIGESAFQNCTSLTSITIPDSVTNIGRYAFSNSSLTSITISDGVTNIGNYAFNNCSSLTSITISDGVTNIGECAFNNCKYLSSITYMGTVSQWRSIALGNFWNFSTGNYTIHCTDGDIAKNGTITYHDTQGGDS